MHADDKEKIEAFQGTRDALKNWIMDYFANLKLEDSNSV
jgi:hypothetical protein